MIGIKEIAREEPMVEIESCFNLKKERFQQLFPAALNHPAVSVRKNSKRENPIKYSSFGI